MTTATMSVEQEREAPGLERVTLWALLAFVASLQISIAAAGVLLTLTLVGWVALLVRAKARPAAPAFFLPILVYTALKMLGAVYASQHRFDASQ